MALLPDHPPVHFVWRGVRRRVTRADGPERLYGEWHLSDADFLGVRDYFQVEDETGARYWLFRHGDGMGRATGGQGWVLHGLRSAEPRGGKRSASPVYTRVAPNDTTQRN